MAGQGLGVQDRHGLPPAQNLSATVPCLLSPGLVGTVINLILQMKGLSLRCVSNLPKVTQFMTGYAGLSSLGFCPVLPSRLACHGQTNQPLLWSIDQHLAKYQAEFQGAQGQMGRYHRTQSLTDAV